jgi:transcriptional regulator with XRE-family HTH domain
MGRPPRPLTPQVSAGHRFGAELRRWRLARQLTQRALARRVWHSQEILAKVEKGERWPSWDLATRCDAALTTGGQLAALWPDVERERLTRDRRRTKRKVPAEQQRSL